MSNIVQYFGEGLEKRYDINQALRDGGWGVTFSTLSDAKGMRLVARDDPKQEAVIEKVTCDPLFNMVFVHFCGGGWLCLDHAIEAYARREEPT